MSIEAMKMALEVMESAINAGDWKVDGACDPETALVALRQAIEQAQKQEPVVCLHKRYSVNVHDQIGYCLDCKAEGRMKFVVDDTSPPQRQWVGLTDDEVLKLIDDEIGFNSCCGWEEAFAQSIEAKLKEKNT